MEIKSTNLHNPKEEEEEKSAENRHDHDEEEEAPSLRDFPIDSDQTTTDMLLSSTDAAAEEELFEFLSSSDDISPAEDIIFRGKLIPLNHQNTLRKSPSFLPPKREEDKDNLHCIHPRIRVRSESLSAIQGDKLSRSGSIRRGNNNDFKLIRNSRSLDYRKLSRASNSTVNVTKSPSSQPESIFMERNSSLKGSSKSADATCNNRKGSIRPKWYVIMFGMVRMPPEIELRDIKSRQFRRSSMFPSPRERSSGKGSSSWPPSPPSSSWKFLKALSCKEPASVAVTAPFLVPHQA